LLWEIVRRITVGIEQLRGTPIAAGRTTNTEVNTARRQCIKHTELFSNFEGGVVRQHDACTAQPNARGACGKSGHQHLRRRAHDAGMAVVFAHPKAVIAPSLALSGKV